MDPRELKAAFPSYGPDWDAAIEYGIDVSLIEHNLSLTPADRIEQFEKMFDLYELLGPGHGDPADS